MRKIAAVTLMILFLASPAAAQVLAPTGGSVFSDETAGLYRMNREGTPMSPGHERMMVAANAAGVGQVEKTYVASGATGPIPRQPHRLGLALNYYNFDYKEELDSPLKSTEEEWVTALRLYYNYSANDSGYILLFAEVSLDDDTDYDGSTQAGVPVKQTTKNDFRRFELDLGYTFKGRMPLSLTPYVGIGYRFWERDLGGYKEDYSWFYLPLGLRAAWAPHERISVALNAAVNFMFDGEMDVYDWAYEDMTVELDDKIGCSVELPVTFNLARHWAFVMTPWYEYSKIGQSAWEPIFFKDGTYTGFVLREPSSRTHQYGLRAGLEFVF
ncbi:MAG TPA: hypothetical protein PLR20_13110 [Syntrophales bacterium]|nr:hypothetical protein [Syntrophales bacterium]HPI56727.1 hypothetical protein [Syntrophales bacterium]HPN24848.1 hypothetical protein [Syntrophales bacterium]HQM30283.1 hypothetical protein [Syntrophales bacterium]